MTDSWLFVINCCYYFVVAIIMEIIMIVFIIKIMNSNQFHLFIGLINVYAVGRTTRAFVYCT